MSKGNQAVSHLTYLHCRSDCNHRVLHSFPTRRSSDLKTDLPTAAWPKKPGFWTKRTIFSSGSETVAGEAADLADRKSTRLNSSHVEISYAVFCLKKKNNNT